MSDSFQVGVDENGLGARLGPLIVTGVLARTDVSGAKFLERKPRGKLALALGDSKKLVAHGRVALAEAWARVLVGDRARDPEELLAELVPNVEAIFAERCPASARAQCWSTGTDAFEANSETLDRVRDHCRTLTSRGVHVERVESEIVCVRQLNQEKAAGGNRFLSDLAAMERLVVSLGGRAQAEILAVCGKVGSMSDYSRYFLGPLSGRLHTTVTETPSTSSYRFAGLGYVSFVRDADAKHPLVMLASLVGKYVRELLVTRVWQHYAERAPAPSSADLADTNSGVAAQELSPGSQPVSGYHDPLTESFVRATALVRRQQRIPDVCFERVRAAS